MKKSEHHEIDISRLVDRTSFEDETICLICKNIFWDPVTCAECQNCFCSFCINHWLLTAKNKVCPNRCKFEPKKAPPVIFKLLSKLKLKCKNFESGCKEEIFYDSLKEHEKNCEYDSKECAGCFKKFLLKELAGHENECDLVTVKCQFCTTIMIRKEYKIHSEIDCLQEQIIHNEKNFSKEISLRDEKIEKLKEEIKKEKGELKKLNEDLKNEIYLREEDRKIIIQLQKAVIKLKQTIELQEELRKNRPD